MSQFIYPNFPLARPNIWHNERGGGIFKSEPEEPDAASAGETTWVEHIKSVYTSSQLSGNVFDKILSTDEYDDYEIHNANELALLAYFSAELNAGRGSNFTMSNSTGFVQVADIDLSGFIWVGIDAKVACNGEMWLYQYYGGDYTIANMKSYTGGLFSRLGYNDEQDIYNINLKNAVISSSQTYIGGIIDQIDGDGYREITDCSVEAYIKSEHVVGGVIGYVIGEGVDLYLQNCDFSGTILSKGGYCAGGIIGLLNDGGDYAPYYTYIVECTFNGEILGTATVGGIVGEFCSNDQEEGGEEVDFSMSNCVVNGVLQGDLVGGLFGILNLWALRDGTVNQYAEIYNCAVHAIIDNSKEIDNVFFAVGGAFLSYGWPRIDYRELSFIGTVLGNYDYIFSFTEGDGYRQCVSLGWGNYACFNGLKYYDGGDQSCWGGFRIVPNINDGMPIQKGLFAVAQAAPEQDILQWFKDNGFTAAY